MIWINAIRGEDRLISGEEGMERASGKTLRVVDDLVENANICVARSAQILQTAVSYVVAYLHCSVFSNRHRLRSWRMAFENSPRSFTASPRRHEEQGASEAGVDRERREGAEEENRGSCGLG
jgi:hypothetical protein